MRSDVRLVSHIELMLPSALQHPFTRAGHGQVYGKLWVLHSWITLVGSEPSIFFVLLMVFNWCVDPSEGWKTYSGEFWRYSAL
jgi:hypothetical protein